MTPPQVLEGQAGVRASLVGQGPVPISWGGLRWWPVSSRSGPTADQASNDGAFLDRKSWAGGHVDTTGGETRGRDNQGRAMSGRNSRQGPRVEDCGPSSDDLSHVVEMCPHPLARADQVTYPNAGWTPRRLRSFTATNASRDWRFDARMEANRARRSSSDQPSKRVNPASRSTGSKTRSVPWSRMTLVRSIQSHSSMWARWPTTW